MLAINVASLDAPCVAICWQNFFAVLFEVKISWIEPVVLFIATWLAYSADRWLDGKRYSNHPSAAARHKVFQKVRHFAIAAWFGIAFTGLLLAILFLSTHQILNGLIFFCATLVYFILHWISPSVIRRWMPREMVVALFFAVASTLFVMTKLEIISNNHLLISGSFAVLCFLNILGVACWDYKQDKQTGEVSLATTFPSLVKFHFWICLTVTGISLLLVALELTLLPPEILFCLILSPVLLGAISKLNSLQEIRPTLADCALLTPLLFHLV